MLDVDKEILWTAAFLNERFTERVSPLGWSFVGSLFEQLALRDPLRYLGYPDADTIPATRLWHAHPYVNVAVFQIFYKAFPDFLVPADAVRYFPAGDIRYRKRAPYPSSILSPQLWIALVSHFLQDPLTWSPFNYLAWDRFAQAHADCVRQLQRELDAAQSAEGVLLVLAGTYALDSEFLRIHRWSLTYADVFFKLLALWTGDAAQALVSSVPNRTREVNDELAALAHQTAPLDATLLTKLARGAALTPSEGETAKALATFLERHGHRSFSLDIAQPTFRDDPTQLLGLFRATNAGGTTTQTAVERVRPSLRTSRLQAEQKLAAWQRPFFGPLLALARRYAQLREEQRYSWQKSLAVTRQAYLKLGKDLQDRGVLEEPHDVFYATRDDIESFYAKGIASTALSEQITARKKEWAGYAIQERALSGEAYPLFLRGDMPFVDKPSQIGVSDEWHGRGVSAGIARGVARVVHDPRELGRVGTGEILVAPSTDPAWTPVFARLAGLALERGGVLSHGAVVAREYHLPAVAAVANLTSAIQDGEWIEVDGTNGIVRRAAKFE